MLLDGVNTARILPWHRERIAPLFGNVAQEHTLIRKMTVEENLLLAARVGRRRFESEKEMKERLGENNVVVK